MTTNEKQELPWVASGCATLFLFPFFAGGLFFLIMGVREYTMGQADFFTLIMAVLMGGLFIIIGGGGIIAVIGTSLGYFGLSKRPRKAMVSKEWEGIQVIPAEKSTKLGPQGMPLLAQKTSRVAVLIGLLLVSLIWNGITWAIMFEIWSDGDELVALACVGIFALIGLLLLAATVHHVLKMILVGGTGLEITNESLRPGDPFIGFVHQKGSYKIDSLSVTLICEEIAQYQQGTDTVTVRHTAFEIELFEELNLRANSRKPIAQFEGYIPKEAMHSFKASRNEIYWFFRVKADIPARPDYKEDYRFRVIPELIPQEANDG